MSRENKKNLHIPAGDGEVPSDLTTVFFALRDSQSNESSTLQNDLDQKSKSKHKRSDRRKRDYQQEVLHFRELGLRGMINGSFPLRERERAVIATEVEQQLDVLSLSGAVDIEELYQQYVYWKGLNRGKELTAYYTLIDPNHNELTNVSSKFIFLVIATLVSEIRKADSIPDLQTLHYRISSYLTDLKEDKYKDLMVALDSSGSLVLHIMVGQRKNTKQTPRFFVQIEINRTLQAEFDQRFEEESLPEYKQSLQRDIQQFFSPENLFQLIEGGLQRALTRIENSPTYDYDNGTLALEKDFSSEWLDKFSLEEILSFFPAQEAYVIEKSEDGKSAYLCFQSDQLKNLKLKLSVTEMNGRRIRIFILRNDEVASRLMNQRYVELEELVTRSLPESFQNQNLREACWRTLQEFHVVASETKNHYRFSDVEVRNEILRQVAAKYQIK